MKKQAYTYQTRFGEKQVEGATTFDINKTIMRCLVKNLAMFGLGIYIYAGEDLPEVETTTPLVAKKEEAPTELIVLKKGTTNWEAVVKYVESNKDLSMDKLVQQLGRKYTLSPAIQKELSSLLNK
jgi:ribosomal protein S19